MLANTITRAKQASRRSGMPRASPDSPPPRLDLQARAGEAAGLLKALANPDRLLLLCQLVGQERSVSDLGLLARIGQPSLSQQLGVLRRERLVATRREGKQVIYRVASPAALSVLKTLYGLFCDPARPSPVVMAAPALARPLRGAVVRTAKKLA